MNFQDSFWMLSVVGPIEKASAWFFLVIFCFSDPWLPSTEFAPIFLGLGFS